MVILPGAYQSEDVDRWVLLWYGYPEELEDGILVLKPGRVSNS